MLETQKINWTGSEVNVATVATEQKEKLQVEEILEKLNAHKHHHEVLVEECNGFLQQYHNSDLSSICLRLEQNIEQFKKIIYSLT